MQLLLGFVLQFLVHNACGQEGLVYHFANEDGLPSTEVYCAMMDKQGYMWFGTDAGVCRFNGYDFEIYDQDNGLTDNTVFKIVEDSKGRIWFGTFNRKLCYLDDGLIKEYVYNDTLAKYINSNYGMNNFVVDSMDNIWISFWSVGIIKIDKNGQFHQYINQPQTAAKYFVLHEVEGHALMGNKVFANEDSIDIDFIFQYSNATQSCTFKQSLNIGSIQFIFEKDQKIYVFSKDSLFFFSPNSTKASPLFADFLHDKKISYVFKQDAVLWIATLQNGIYKTELKGDSLRFINQYFANEGFSSIYRDQHQGLWFTGLNNGIYYMPHEKIKRIYANKQGVKDIETDTIRGRVFISWDNGLLTASSVDSYVEQLDTLMNFRVATNSIKYNYRYQYLDLGIVESNNNVMYDSTVGDQKIFIPSKTTKDLLFQGDTSYRIGHSGLSVEYKKSAANGKSIENSLFWGTSVTKYDDKILFGTKNGLLYLKDTVVQSYPDSIKYLQVSISSLANFNDYVLVGTKSYGLLLLHKDTIFDIINKNDGLASSLVRCLHVDHKNQIWVGTNNGLSKINYNGKGNYECHNFTPLHGLNSKEIKSINSINDIIYVGTNYGLHTMRGTMDKKTAVADVEVTQFFVDFKPCEMGQPLDFAYHQNNIRINYFALDLTQNGSIRYEYRVLGADSNWTSTYARHINLPLLSPNNYRLEIRSYNLDNVAGKTTCLDFRIHPPFWQRWWFFMIIGLSIAFVIYILVKNRERKINEKATLQTQIIDLELKSLRSQMNPHFIFNTLNTIQNAVNTLDIRFASDYISRFGKLIRLVLESSKKSKVSLGTEIEMLRLYVHLEGLRFSNKFSFRIEIDPDIDVDSLEIPSMVIQPFVENAILHGLTPKTEDNLMLSLSFDLINENTLCCIVEDNGIGRAASEQLKKKKQLQHNSMGMEITQQRLSLYFKETGNKFSFEINDLKDANNKASGTSVKIIFAV